MDLISLGIGIGAGAFLLWQSIVIIRPTHRALIERFGNYKRFLDSGIHFKIPFVEGAYRVNITEKMMDVESQEVITNDNLNAGVDAQVYYKVMADEKSVKASQYNVFDYERQITQLARTTLRDIIGKLDFKDVNSKRDELNLKLKEGLKEETTNWGIEVVRTELKEIEPPKDVQDTMNKVLKAENEKRAAIDYATATETKADGSRRAEIKEAEGRAKAVELEAGAEAKAITLVANANAKAIELVSNSAEKHFKNRAQIQKQLEVVEKTFGHGTKWILPSNAPLLNVLPLGGESSLEGIISTPDKKTEEQGPEEEATFETEDREDE